MEYVVKGISARQVVATVNEWLVSYVGDRFTALWLVPILYNYPKEGPLGTVGEIKVDSMTGELSGHPSIEEIKRRTEDLYRAKRDEDPAFLPSRD